MAINTDDIKWASNDVTDPITGGANKVQPTAEFQNDGLKANEPLAMEYINYMWDKNHEQHVDLQNQINALVLSTGSAIIEQIYHVGSYYFSDSSQSPSARFGFGTWERVKGKFIVGLDEDDTNFNSAGKVGGSKTHTHTNNITINSAGNHTHEVAEDGWGSVQSGGGLPEPSYNGTLVTGAGKTEISELLESLGHATGSNTTTSSGGHTHTTSGGINAASSLPPFRSAYVWVRTA